MKQIAFVPRVRWWGLLSLIVIVAGCGPLRQPPPNKAVYLLDIAPDTSPLAVQPTVCCRVRPVSVRSPFSGTRLIYRRSETTFERDYYNEFLVPPDQQNSQALHDWLPSVGLVLCATSVLDEQTEQLVLEPHLEALYADFRDPHSPSAYVRLRFVLITTDRSCKCSRILVDESFEAAVGVPPRPTAEQVVVAMSQAVSDAFAQFHATLESLFP